MEKIINEKLKYLYEMADKYDNLNKNSKNTYSWRTNAINDQIEILEDVKEGNKVRRWDEAYKEDLEESKER